MFKSPLSFRESFLESPVSSPRLPVHLIEALVSGGAIYDFEFDQVLPARFRAITDIHWSPVEVARQIAFALRDRPKARFVDVGAGPGKLCLLLALLTDLEISGIEQRKDLVEVARQICAVNAPGRVEFIHGNMLTLDWDRFDVFYLYNPFQEHICTHQQTDHVIDHRIRFGVKAYIEYINEIFRQLELLKPKKRVITFHGYGGSFPASMKLLESYRIERGTLNIWEKV